MAYRGQDAVTRRQSRFYFLSIGVSVLLSFLALASYFSGVSSVLSNIVNIIVSPINSFCTGITENFSDMGDYFRDISELKKENLRLQAENAELSELYAKTEAIRKENEQLYTYLDLKREFTNFTLVNARVISKGSGNFTTTFTIDKGSLHGIKKDMPVLGSGSIFGIITEVGLTSSRGISLINYNASAGVYLLRSGISGVVEGDYSLSQNGKCKVSGIPPDAEITEGDLVYTSGFGEIFPKDLFVGTVTEIIRDSNTHTLTLAVTPGCDLLNTGTVMVVTNHETEYTYKRN